MEIGGVDWAFKQLDWKYRNRKYNIVTVLVIYLYFHYFYCDFPDEFEKI